MKIKNDLVERVRKGEACIWHTMIENDLPKLKNLITELLSVNMNNVYGKAEYYFLVGDNWVGDDELPSGMVAIPLDKFFKQERVEEGECMSIGQILSEAFVLHELNPDVVDNKLKLTSGTVQKLMNDEMYTNNVPIRLFCNLILSLHIPISEIEGAILHTFRLVSSRETPESIKKKPIHYQLWENEEAVNKYLIRLKEIYGQQKSN
jgi:hypothetical protein